jgi:hypothetical protein
MNRRFFTSVHFFLNNFYDAVCVHFQPVAPHGSQGHCGDREWKSALRRKPSFKHKALIIKDYYDATPSETLMSGLQWSVVRKMPHQVKFDGGTAG